MGDSPLLHELLSANERYADVFGRSRLEIPPAKHLAVLACMDARLTVPEFLDLRAGDAHIVRNAGGIATDDAIRSLIISTELLGTREFIVVNPTDCGMLSFQDKDLQAKRRKKTGKDASAIPFHAFSDLKENVKQQVDRIRSSPFLPKDIPSRASSATSGAEGSTASREPRGQAMPCTRE